MTYEEVKKAMLELNDADRSRFSAALNASLGLRSPFAVLERDVLEAIEENAIFCCAPPEDILLPTAEEIRTACIDVLDAVSYSDQTFELTMQAAEAAMRRAVARAQPN